MARIVSQLSYVLTIAGGIRVAALTLCLLPTATATAEEFDKTRFKATHNSYGPSRGSIPGQLDLGIRFIELDFHDNDFVAERDYKVGHFSPGQGVATGGGNPETLKLVEWFAAVARWSDQHEGHGPIVIGLDAKDDLTDNRSYAEGNLAFLNSQLRLVFGKKLFQAEDLKGKWPDVAELRGRVLVVLSGHLQTRREYVWDEGHSPAVAMNGKGQVIEVHDSGGGHLWYWTGQYDNEDDRVRWHHHGRFDTGTTVAVAINDEGVIVEVHRSEVRPELFYRVGRMHDDHDVTWSASHKYDSGIEPTIRFVDGGGLRVREIHRSEWRRQNFALVGTVDPEAGTINWDRRAQPVGEDRFNKATARVGDQWVTVSSGGDMAPSRRALLYAARGGKGLRIRYDQVAFVEYQNGEPEALVADACFVAAPASELPSAARWAGKGKLVRLWGFNELPAALRDGSLPHPNFPATDNPTAIWYSEYCERIGTFE